MTAPATPQPRLRRWKRWAIVGVVVFAIGLWLNLSESREVVQARGVKLGMTLTEVVEIVGDSKGMISYQSANKLGLVLGVMRTRWCWFASMIEQRTGWQMLDGSFDAWPVHITFDANGRVDRIKRGSEIVER